MNVNIFNNKYKGFLLIELVIAIGIFSLIALLSLSFYWHITKQNLENEMEIRAINIASSCLEQLSVFANPSSLKLLRTGASSDTQATKNISQEFMVDKKYHVITVPISVKKGQYKKRFVLVKIVVNWEINDKNKSVSLVTGVII